jgi:hypothetical protein
MMMILIIIVLFIKEYYSKNKLEIIRFISNIDIISFYDLLFHFFLFLNNDVKHN